MRAPFQVLIFPYIQTDKKPTQFCLFKRKDLGIWQGIAGGGEDDETPIETAVRETREEINIISPASDFSQLESLEYIPAKAIGGLIWGKNVTEVPEYTFGLSVNKKKMNIGREHIEYKWLPYEDAVALLEWESNISALTELNHQLLEE